MVDLRTAQARVLAHRISAVDWAYVRRATAWLPPLVFAAVAAVVVIKYLRVPAWIGIDARLYAAAADAMLRGADPWAVSDTGVFFGAPPPTLLAFVPFALLGPVVTTVAWMAGSAALAVVAVRSLRLPLWWVLFPPVVDAILAGNPDVAVLAALIVGGGRFAAVAPFLKLYALIPMVGERRWRTVAASLALLVVTVPLLPWARWVSEFPVISGHLASASATTSVFGQPVLMVIAAVALLALGMRRAGWLAVPLLWPSTQFHYAAISVPGLSPFLALAWCFPAPEAWLAAVVVAAAHRWLIERRASDRVVARDDWVVHAPGSAR